MNYGFIVVCIVFWRINTTNTMVSVATIVNHGIFFALFVVNIYIYNQCIIIISEDHVTLQ